MSDKPTLNTARKIEELMTTALELNGESELIAPNFVAVLRVVQRNVVKRFYNKYNYKGDKS